MKSNTKDYVLLGIFSALNFVAIMVGAVVSNMFGPISHILLGGSLGGVLSGSLMLVLSKKTNIKWIFTKVYIVTIVIFQVMGQGYLPWVISIVVSAIIADLLCMPNKYSNRFILALSHGITILGISGGSLFPILLFADKYKATWVSKGIPADYLDKSIEFLQGPMWITTAIVAVLGGIAGVYLGHIFFNKHFSRVEGRRVTN